MDPKNIVKIKRRECLLQYPKFPIIKNEDDCFFPASVASYKLTVHASSNEAHNQLLGAVFTAFIKELDIDSLIFLGDAPTPFRYRDSDYKPAKEALEFLVAAEVGKRFSGGLEVGLEELAVFIMHLVWLVSTNTVLPYIHCMDHGQRMVASVCQYGSVHFSVLDKQMAGTVSDAIRKVGFTLVNGECISEHR